MNIFYLHHIAPVAASMHCDKHVGKMLMESCQLLATAHHHFGNGHAVTYKPTHANHPSAIWCRESRLHYDWLVDLANYLGREFFNRYGKRHKCHDILHAELYYAPPALAQLPLTWRPPSLAMPDDYKSDDHVQSYRRFYASKANRMPMVYYKGQRKPPIWLADLWQQSTIEEIAA